jgi:aspartate ammonia-lyase
MPGTRTEIDALGTKAVPRDAYYGIQTVRALDNFPVSGLTNSPRLIRAYLLLKKAAAEVNGSLGLLPPEVAGAIAAACDEALAGRLDDQFPVDVYQMGAGTSLHMNVNEVLANQAIEILGKKRGDYAVVHPNDHVNYAQSTNDTFPTAMRVATRTALGDLTPQMELLQRALAAKGREFDNVIKSARTHLQDAVPIRLGQEFAAYSVTIRKCLERVQDAAASVEELGIGGSAAGTGLNTHPQYRFLVISRLGDWTGFPFRPAPDMREAMQSNLPMAEVSSAMKLLALELTRIANDFRLLASGPTTGLNEIVLPAVQPGSSIMPGKVNPSMAEMLNMVCFQVLGNDATVSMAVQAGQLELNVMMPVIAHNVLFSAHILTNALRVFTEKCVAGIKANRERCRRYAEISPSLATALNPYIGYAKAAEVTKQAVAEERAIPEVVREKGYLTDDQIREILDPLPMTEPGIPGKAGSQEGSLPPEK